MCSAPITNLKKNEKSARARSRRAEKMIWFHLKHNFTNKKQTLIGFSNVPALTNCFALTASDNCWTRVKTRLMELDMFMFSCGFGCVSVWIVTWNFLACKKLEFFFVFVFQVFAGFCWLSSYARCTISIAYQWTRGILAWILFSFMQ